MNGESVEILGVFIGGLILNLFLFAYGYGKISQKVENNTGWLKGLDDKLEQHKDFHLERGIDGDHD